MKLKDWGCGWDKPSGNGDVPLPKGTSCSVMQLVHPCSSAAAFLARVLPLCWSADGCPLLCTDRCRGVPAWEELGSVAHLYPRTKLTFAARLLANLAFNCP